MKINSVGKTFMHANSRNILTVLRDETVAETALTLHCICVQMEVVILQVGLTCPRTTGLHAHK